MKKKILKLVLLFLFFSSTIKAQNVTGTVLGTDFSYEQISNSEHHFTFHTYFSLGYGSTCPPFLNYQITIENDIMLVKGFYDIRGAWPFVGCDRTDTVIYNNIIPSNITHIITSTNVITYSSDSSGFTTVENVYTRDFDLNALSNNNIKEEKNIEIYPNPTKNYINIKGNYEITKVEITNQIGQIIKSINIEDNILINIEELQNGIYYIIYYKKENQKFGISKFIKI